MFVLYAFLTSLIYVWLTGSVSYIVLRHQFMLTCAGRNTRGWCMEKMMCDYFQTLRYEPCLYLLNYLYCRGTDKKFNIGTRLDPRTIQDSTQGQSINFNVGCVRKWIHLRDTYIWLFLTIRQINLLSGWQQFYDKALVQSWYIIPMWAEQTNPLWTISPKMKIYLMNILLF